MRISDWSSDVCSSDLGVGHVTVVAGRLVGAGKTVGRDQEGGLGGRRAEVRRAAAGEVEESTRVAGDHAAACSLFSVTASAASTSDQSAPGRCAPSLSTCRNARPPRSPWNRPSRWRVMCLRNTPRASCSSTYGRSARSSSPRVRSRSEEHTSELQSLMRISYAVFCLKKKNNQNKH